MAIVNVEFMHACSATGTARKKTERKEEMSWKK